VKGFGCRLVVTYPAVVGPAFFNRAALGKSKVSQFGLGDRFSVPA
jgi:hypothetical protein